LQNPNELQGKQIAWRLGSRDATKLQAHQDWPTATGQDDQIASLDAIGFEWNFKPDPCAPESDAMWEQNFKRLKDYKDEHDDFDIPIEGEMGDLGKWARVQRNQNNLRETKRKCFITKERIKKLNEISFDWKGSRKIDWKKGA
jgi:Helicase associated domain